jgi:uncharacterized membrane protein
MATSTWGLSLVYWLHMLATVVWIGGLAALVILVLPAARRALDAQAYASFLAGLQRRLDPLGWFCLVVLAGSGMIQMGSNPNYQGFLAIRGQWATALILKHLAFLVMVGLSAYMSWGLLPKMRRLALQQAVRSQAAAGQPVSGEPGEQLAAGLARQEALLLRLNLILGVIILALTAVARTA